MLQHVLIVAQSGCRHCCMGETFWMYLAAATAVTGSSVVQTLLHLGNSG